MEETSPYSHLAGNRSDSQATTSDRQWRRTLQLSRSGYALAVLTVAALILRLLFLNSKSLWLDEAWSAFRATSTLRQLIKQLIAGNMNMALYHVILHWWTQLAGSSETSLRLPSVIFATATVPLIYALGAELCDRKVGVMAALLLTVNVSSIQFAQQARSYAMVGMLVTLSSLLFIRCIGRNSLERRAAYMVAGPWCAYVHFFGILILPAQWLSLFLFPADRKTRLQLTACIAVIGILSLPPIILSILRDHGQVSWIPATSTKTVIHLFAMFAGLYWGELGGSGWLLFATYLAAIGLGVAGANERERPVIGFLVLSVVLPVGITLLLSISKPLLVARYLLMCLPSFVILAAIGIMRLKPRGVLVATAVLIVALSLSEDLTFYLGSPMQDWRGAINFVAANTKPGDVLVVFPQYDVRPVDYYVGRLSRPPDFRVIVAGVVHNRMHSGSDFQINNLNTFLVMHGVDLNTRVWMMTDQGHEQAPEVRALEGGHRLTPGPHLAGVNVVLVE